MFAGFICRRGDLLANNCCNMSEKRYICDTCNVDGCCVLYEHCVSCCLDPDKVSIVMVVEKFNNRNFCFFIRSTENALANSTG